MLGLGLSLSSTPVIGGAINAPSFALDFRNGDNPVTKYGFVFTRATTATYVNSAGLLATAASGELRYDYDPVTLAARGILVEEASTNLVASSANPHLAGTASVAVTQSQTDPAGGTTATLATGIGFGPTWVYDSGGTVTYTSGTTYTLSKFVKPGTETRIQLTGPSAAFGGSQYANFRLTGAGSVLASVGCTATIVQVGAWYRIAISLTASGSAGGNCGALGFINSDLATRLVSFDSTGLTVYAAFTQAEAKAFPTSYIPTTGAAATRNADALTLTGAAGRTNLCSYSNDFTSATGGWSGTTRASVVGDAAIAPDGTMTADALVEDGTATSTHYANKGSINVSNSTSYTYSIYLKPNGRTFVRVQPYSGAAHYADFQLVGAGTIGTQSGGVGAISSVGNGWYRCEVRFTSSATGVAQTLYLLEADNDTSYSGDGTSGVYLWGAQLETGSSATAYIPTTNGPRTVENVASWFNGDTGTWVVHGRSPNNTAQNARIVMLRNNSGWYVLNNLISTTSALQLNAAGDATSFTTAVGSLPVNTSYKSATAWNGTDSAAVLNGGAAGTGSTYVSRAFFQYVHIGSYGGSLYLNSTIAYLAFYPRRLSNASLQALTA